MKVTAIKTKDKPFFKKGDGIPYHTHDIYFIDEANGNKKYTGEYVIQSPQQHDFKVGYTYNFHVTIEGQWGDEIQIGLSPAEKPVEKKNEVVNDVPKNVPQETNYQVKSMSGAGYTFAVSYSKDIHIAKIRAGLLTKEEADDIDGMIFMAKEIYAAMVEMQQNQITHD